MMDRLGGWGWAALALGLALVCCWAINDAPGVSELGEKAASLGYMALAGAGIGWMRGGRRG